MANESWRDDVLLQAMNVCLTVSPVIRYFVSVVLLTLVVQGKMSESTPTAPRHRRDRSLIRT